MTSAVMYNPMSQYNFRFSSVNAISSHSIKAVVLEIFFGHTGRLEKCQNSRPILFDLYIHWLICRDSSYDWPNNCKKTINVNTKYTSHCIRRDNPRTQLSIPEQNSTPEQFWGWDFNPRMFWCSGVYSTPLYMTFQEELYRFLISQLPSSYDHVHFKINTAMT